MQRKNDHLELALTAAQLANEADWWSQVLTTHNALPEIALTDVDLQVERPEGANGFPLMVAGMTGGTREAARVNQILASVCEAKRLPLGLGSLRPLLKDPGAPGYHLKKSHPDLILYGNIGGTQLVEEQRDLFGRLLAWADELSLDAFCVHLNPAQEMMQPEGDRDFGGIVDALAAFRQESSLTLVVKETGCGLTPQVVQRLRDIAIGWCDISGVGGTSWTWIENARSTVPKSAFDRWGVPTPAALAAVHQAVPKVSLIASGGIRNGVDAVKALVLGASLAGIARPALSAATHGEKELAALLERLIYEMNTAALLLGCRTVDELRQQPWIFSGALQDWERLLSR